jgi:hypothetical protein
VNGNIGRMADQTIVVLVSDHEPRALPLAFASSVIHWLRGGRDKEHLQIGARLTEESTVFTVSGRSEIVESWLADRCGTKRAGPGSRMIFDDNTSFVVKRCVVAPQPAQKQQNRSSSTDSGSDDFGRMIDVMTKMAAVPISNF